MTWLWPNGKLRTTAKSAFDFKRALFEEDTWGNHTKAVCLNELGALDVSIEAKFSKNGTAPRHESATLTDIVTSDTKLAEWN